jgi:cytochrome P450
MTSDLYWDPFTPELRNDPYPLWKRMRNEAPVWHNDRYDFWALSRFHDIEEANKDHDTFISSHGTTVETMTEEPAETGMIIWTDPPKHTRLRKLVSRAFTARRVSSLEDRMREVCAELLDPFVGEAEFDYVQDFSAVLPPTMISTLLGVPEGDRDYLRKLVDDIFHIEEGAVGMVNDVSVNGLTEMAAYMSDQFADRKRNPRDDMFTDLLNAEIVDDDGELRRLSDSELSEFVIVLFTAGTETVARHLGWSVDLLDQHPDQRAELAADLSLVANAVEESLRYEPPSPVNARYTSRDVTLHDVTIPAQSRVVLVTGAAGRDERMYPNPDVFDIHRDFDLHMTLGYGIHFCLGAALARMEGRIGIEETLKRWPEWTIDRDNAVPLYTSTVRGYLNLPIAA